MSDFDDGVKHFTNNETHLLSEILYDVLNMNSKQFEFLLKLGAIYANNNRQTKDGWILAESLLRIHSTPKRYKTDYNWNSLVVFENDFCLVLNKPSGLPSHPTVDNTLENALSQMSLTRK
ncbi:MAG: RluA family pseudouridine synthase, partial [Bdellovibrionaceae bacterium]|nr:RluA family pseudouridine synthase [Pseudobdellovibrionaceae bacterium]